GAEKVTKIVPLCLGADHAHDVATVIARGEDLVSQPNRQPYHEGGGQSERMKSDGAAHADRHRQQDRGGRGQTGGGETAPDDYTSADETHTSDDTVRQAQGVTVFGDLEHVETGDGHDARRDGDDHVGAN